MTEPTTPQTEPVDPVPDPTPSAPQPAVSPTVTPGPDQMVYAPDGKTWKSKYLGADGTRLQVEEARAREQGRYEQQIKEFEQQVHQLNAEIERLKSEAGALTEQIETIPGLRTELDELKKRATEADRLRTLMRYPNLLAVEIEEQRRVEGQEEPETVKLNPFLALIENTTLSDQALEQEIGRLATILPQLANVGPVPAQPQPVTEGAVPQPAQPVPTTDVDACRAEAMKWHQVKLSGQSGPNGEDPVQMEQQAWEKYYEAMAASQQT